MNKKFQLKELLLSSTIDGESEFFPLLSDEDEQKIDKEKNPEVLPILPLRNTVLFPGVIIPITVTSCLLYTSPSPRDVEESRMAGWG